MATPYWGNLDPPSVARQNTIRRSTNGANMDMQSQLPSLPGQSRVNRTSLQSQAPTISTQSPFASPTVSSFQAEGLAPRPPSFPYAADGPNRDYAERRRRRASHDIERHYDDKEDSGPPPAAPDAPRPAPPLSYKQPYNPAEPYNSYSVPTKSRSTRRQEGPIDASQKQYSVHRERRHETANTQDNVDHKELNTSGDYKDDRISNGDTEESNNTTIQRAVKKERHESTVPHRTRKELTIDADTQRRREWAPDRSPLQRLELTLDSITKGEKRARVEEAEFFAKQAKAGWGDRVSQNSVRFRNRPVSKGSEKGVGPEPQSPQSANPSRNFSSKQKEESQSGTGENKNPTITNSDPEGQLDRGFEYQLQGATATSTGPTSDSEKSINTSGSKFRDRVTVLPATVAKPTTHEGISRSASNKLKKEPPGDPWYSRRLAAEMAAQQIASRNYATDDGGEPSRSGGPLTSAPAAEMNINVTGEKHKYSSPSLIEDGGSNSDEILPHVTVRRNSSKKIEQLTGHKIGAGPLKNISFPRQQQPYLNPDKQKDLGPRKGHENSRSQLRAETGFGDNIKHSEPSDTTDSNYTLRPNIGNFNHQRRSQYQPGTGIYTPSQRLDEWKNAGVAALTGSLLDLKNKQTVIDKDKAWWETNQTGKRKHGTMRQVNLESFDGGYENSNGMVFSASSQPVTQGIGRPAPSVVVGISQTIISRFFIPANLWLSKKQEEAPRFQSLGFIITETFKTLTNSMRFIRVHNVGQTQFKPTLLLKCGPLLRYCGMRQDPSPDGSGQSGNGKSRVIWRGSIMIVTTDSKSSYEVPPIIRLFSQPTDLLPPPPAQVGGTAGELAPEYVDPIAGLAKVGRDGKTLFVRPVEQLDEGKDLSGRDDFDDGIFETQRNISHPVTSSQDMVSDPKGSFAGHSQRFGADGEKLGKYAEVKGFRLHTERGVTFWRFNIEVELQSQQQRIAYRINQGPASSFWVPAEGQSMSIMFYSCNGFSLGVDTDQFSGPDPLWRDVLNTHQTQPFHVMIGGGDQIYNDLVMEESDLFKEWLDDRNTLHKHNAPFGPEMQDELETFYLERYSTWFSQGLFGLASSQIPMINIFDDHDIIDGFGSYPQTLMESPVFAGLGGIAFKYYMLFQHQSIIDEGEETEPSWLLGVRPGPYIKELSRSVFMSLGPNIAFLGLDCRTERSHEDIVSDETYEKIFHRLRNEIVMGETRHLIVLLGVPIAYPRLIWLENILTSRLMDPLKVVGKSGFFGKLLNQFDGGIEILDDLDDHWTARNHKAERKRLIEKLQELAAEKSMRITILGGDVHLAAIGQFYSNPKLKISKDRDHRYMPNVISSAIANMPPPEVVVDILNRRNKVHHLNEETDESMIPLFAQDASGLRRNNKHMMSKRNWCSIREYTQDLSLPSTPCEERSPSPAPRRGFLRRLSVSRGPYRADTGPPISMGMRNLSLTRGRPSMDSERPKNRRSLSLSRKDFIPASFFRRRTKRRPDDGGINGYGAESDEDELSNQQVDVPNLRGGVGEEEFILSRGSSRRRIGRRTIYDNEGEDPDSDNLQQNDFPHLPPQQYRSQTQHVQEREQMRRPFHRVPTGISEKERRTGDRNYEINLEGGLDICIYVEVNQRDPAGITTPYKLLVPALWYNYKETLNHYSSHEERGSGLMKFMSFSRGR